MHTLGSPGTKPGYVRPTLIRSRFSDLAIEKDRGTECQLSPIKRDDCAPSALSVRSMTGQST